MKIITLCGSTRFREEYEKANEELTLAGNIVLSVGLFGKVEGDSGKDKNKSLTYREKELLDKIHLRKIDLSDEIFVLNVGGYIGESTEREIDYARRRGKKVRFLSGMTKNKMISFNDDVKFLCEFQHFIPFGTRQRCLHSRHPKRNPWVYPLCGKSVCPILNRHDGEG